MSHGHSSVKMLTNCLVTTKNCLIIQLYRYDWASTWDFVTHSKLSPSNIQISKIFASILLRFKHRFRLFHSAWIFELNLFLEFPKLICILFITCEEQWFLQGIISEELIALLTQKPHAEVKLNWSLDLILYNSHKQTHANHFYSHR